MGALSKKYMDLRPICDCAAYAFPHKLGGGKCDATVFTEYYYIYDRECCDMCNCNHEYHCDVASGQERIEYGECYMDAKQSGPAYHVPLEFVIEEEEEEYYEYD